jgi:hypothetical protein
MYESYTLERYELLRGKAGDLVFRRLGGVPGREEVNAPA